ncbi:LLM class oxidoreductase [Jatrophihabitans fulvus]
MRTATTVEFGDDPHGTGEFARECEKLGLDVCWVAEAWGADAVAPLGWLAARTERMLLGSAVLQVGTRTAAAVAMAARTLQHLSGGRFLLGLGPSGPQVLEGLHGVPFGRPLARTRDTVAVVRAALAGERVAHEGATLTVPLPGEARPMKLSGEPVAVPVYLAALAPGMLRLTGELADGWLGTSFVPEAAAAYLDPLRAGAESAGRTLADLDLCQGAEVAFVDDEDDLAALLAPRRRELAFSLGGMGSATTNFYNDAYSRQGWGEAAVEVRRLWQDGRRDAAAAVVTDEMVLATTLIGTEPMVRERLTVWRDAGVDTVRLYPAGHTVAARLDTLGRAIDLVRSL